MRDLLRDLIAKKPSRSAPDATLEVRARSPSAGGRLLRDGKEILRTDCYPYLIASLEHEVGRLVAQNASGHCLLHAGAVAHAGRGLLLPGDAGAGKTTLVAFLVQQGFEYFSDDMAALRLDSSRLAPLPRPMRVKGDAARLLAPLDRRLVIRPYGGRASGYPGRYALPPQRRVGRSPRPLGSILFVYRVAGCQARLAEMSKGEAVLGLARRALNFERLGEKGLDFLVELVRRVPCYRLEFDDLPGALKTVRALTERRMGTPRARITRGDPPARPGRRGAAPHRRTSAG
jgi:hypothetical protein